MKFSSMIAKTLDETYVYIISYIWWDGISYQWVICKIFGTLALKINSVKWNIFFEHVDQVEHAHDNPLDEITLGEAGTTGNTPLDEIPAEKPVTPKKIYWEVEGDPEGKCELEVDPQMEEEKQIKKEGKKEKSKG